MHRLTHVDLLFALLLAPLSFLTAPAARAQLTETFSDHDFTSDPAWIGKMDRWSIGDLNGPALQSDGTAAADTIHLATSSETAFGAWHFTIAHRSVNLSSFNGIRIFLMSDRPDPHSHAIGYYLQFGTNNADAISLWRVDGSLASQRVELGRSATAIVAGDSSLVRIVADRDVFGRFRVYADDELIISATDSRYSSSAFFAVWVKHSAQGAKSYLIDDIVVIRTDDESAGPIPESGEIVINEVLFDPLPEQSEFVELQNRGQSGFDLGLLRLRDLSSGDLPISYSSLVLEPGAFAVLVDDAAAFASLDDDIRIVSLLEWPSLNNGGDVVVLSGPNGIIDSLSYDGAGSIRGVSQERIDPHGPSEPYNFTRSVDASGSTPGRPNSVFKIDDAPPSIRFIEQTGATTLELHFDEQVRVDDLGPTDIEYEAGILELRPLSPTSIHIVLDRPPTYPSIAISHIRDRKGNRSGRLTHPISFIPAAGDLALSEIMYEPLADGFDGRADQVEFVELVNTSGRRLSLSQLIRTRDVDEEGDADTLRFGRPLSALAPGAFLVVSAADSGTVRAGYPSGHVDVQAMYVNAPGLTLANGGDRFRILNRLREVVDDVTYDPGWHHPDLALSRGVSLERIDLGSSVADEANWSSSASPDGATPGSPNSIAYLPGNHDASRGIVIDPSPFSPDGDGHDDAAVITYRLRAKTPNVRVRIYDIDGFVVRTLVPAALTSPEGRIVWDGLDHAERRLRVGIYIVVFEAVDAETRRVEQYKCPVVLARRFN